MHGRTYAPYYIYSVIAILVAAVYWPGLNGPFLLDDLTSILPAQVDALTLEHFLNKVLANTTGPLGRPLSVTTFILNNYWGDASPFSFKVINLILHVGCGYLLFLLIRHITRHCQIHHATAIALSVSAIWLLHPLQVSTVLYAVQRMAILSSLFMLLGALGYVVGRIRISQGRPGGLGLLYGSALLCLPLAILSKENGATLALYYLCLEYCVFTQGRRPIAVQSFLYLFAWLPLIMSLMYVSLSFETYMGRFATQGFTLWERLYTQPFVLGWYLKQMIVPRLSEMSLFLDGFPIRHTLSLQVVGTFFAHIALITTAIIYRHRFRLLCFAILWFYASHVIESTILPLEMAFEHRNYLAILGVILLPVLLLYHPRFALVARPAFRTAIIGAWLCILIALTLTRAHTWSDLQTFLSIAVDEQPESPRAHISWANHVLTQNVPPLAIQHLEHAYHLNPNNAGIMLHQLIIYCQSQQPPADVIARTRQAIQSGYISAYAMTGFETLTDKKLNNQCPQLSHRDFFLITQDAIQNKSLSHQADWTSALYRYHANAYMLLEDYEHAVYWLGRAFKHYPKRLLPLLRLAEYQILQHDFVAAKQTIVHIQRLRSQQWFEFADYVPLLEALYYDYGAQYAQQIVPPYRAPQTN